MSSVPTPQEIWRDARWLAQAVDPNAGLVRFVEMSAEDYREASFLDDRMFEKPRNSHLLEWSEVADAMPEDARTDARWIFHIGHVGSTLVSRLLGELDSVLAVREPRSLRDLTFFPHVVRDSFVPTICSLMSRTFGVPQTAVVKATSMVSGIGAELAGKSGRALLLFASPDVYLQTILAGGQSQSDLQRLSSYYSSRAASRGIEWPGAPESPASVAGLVWACEMAGLEDAARALTVDKVLWLTFDKFLDEPHAGLAAIAQFFGLSVEADRIAEIVRGPLIRRYSKALQHEFGADARRQLLDEAAARHGPAIQQALAMLERAAENTPALACAIGRSTTDR